MSVCAERSEGPRGALSAAEAKFRGENTEAELYFGMGLNFPGLCGEGLFWRRCVVKNNGVG